MRSLAKASRASLLAGVLVLTGCGAGKDAPMRHRAPRNPAAGHPHVPADAPAVGKTTRPSAGNVYAADRPGQLSPAVRGDPALV